MMTCWHGWLLANFSRGILSPSIQRLELSSSLHCQRRVGRTHTGAVMVGPGVQNRGSFSCTLHDSI